MESRDERAVVAVEIPSHLLLQWHDEAAAATSTPKFFHVERLNASIIGQVVIITRSGPIGKRIKVNCCLKSQGIGLEEKKNQMNSKSCTMNFYAGETEQPRQLHDEVLHSVDELR